MRAGRSLALLCLFTLPGFSAPDAAGRFAISCTGNAKFSYLIDGRPDTRNYDMPPQIYVFDEPAKEVLRALMPRREFESVCSAGELKPTAVFSAGSIRVRWESRGDRCEFKLDRANGTATFFSHSALPAGGHVEMDWQMTCERTEVPVFDSSRKRR